MAYGRGANKGLTNTRFGAFPGSPQGGLMGPRNTGYVPVSQTPEFMKNTKRVYDPNTGQWRTQFYYRNRTDSRDTGSWVDSPTNDVWSGGGGWGGGGVAGGGGPSSLYKWGGTSGGGGGGRSKYDWLEGWDFGGAAPGPYEVTDAPTDGYNYAAWNPDTAPVPEMTFDLEKYMETYRPAFEKKMRGDMSAAARQAGAGGMLMGDEYVGKLGEAETERDVGLTGAILPYMFEAGKETYGAQTRAREAALDRALQAYGFGHEAELDRVRGGRETWRDVNQMRLQQSQQDLERWAREKGYNLDQLRLMTSLWGPYDEPPAGFGR